LNADESGQIAALWRSCGKPRFLLLPAGCGLLGPPGLPQDPLFISRQPIQANAATAARPRSPPRSQRLPPIPAEIAKRPSYARRPAG